MTRLFETLNEPLITVCSVGLRLAYMMSSLIIANREDRVPVDDENAGD